MTTQAPRSPQTTVASNRSLCLPEGYRQQPGNLTLDVNRAGAGSYWAAWRLADNRKWQFHVYQWAADLVRKHGLTSVVDVGCGPCVKLINLVRPVCEDIEGLDQPPALAAARTMGADFPLTPVDLEHPEHEPTRTFDLIVCADVIEHLADPDPALDLIRTLAHEGSLVLISTPERDRERGRDCMASTKPEHVREWTRDEFERFLRSRGFTPVLHRLLPKDDADPAPLRDGEKQFRLRRAPTSPLCCQAWVCRVSGKRTPIAD